MGETINNDTIILLKNKNEKEVIELDLDFF
jgi:hypothetical protein